MNKDFTKLISTIRFPLIVFVVIIHSPKVFIGNYELYPELSLIESKLFDIIVPTIKFITDTAVPCFFIISGYLFFYNINSFTSNLYIKKLKSRIKTLFIPYIIWNTIPIAIATLLIFKGIVFNQTTTDYLLSYIGSLNFCHIFYEDPTKYWSILNIFGNAIKTTYPINYPLWYIRDLICICIYSPIIYYLIKNLRIYFLLIVFFLETINIIPNFAGLSSFPIFFFSVGAYLSLYKVDILHPIQKYKIFIIILCIIAILISVICNKNIYFYLVDPTFNLIAICSFILFANNTTIFSRIPKYCTDQTFFIYVSHAVYITFISKKIITLIIPETIPFASTLRLISNPILTICILLGNIIQRIMPRCYKVLCGSR